MVGCPWYWVDFDGSGLDSLSRLSEGEKKKPRQDEADAGMVAEEGIEEGIEEPDRSSREMPEEIEEVSGSAQFISDCLESSMCWTGMEMI